MMKSTRRTFVKMAGIGVGAAALAPYAQALAATGRMVVISNGVWRFGRRDRRLDDTDRS